MAGVTNKAPAHDVLFHGDLRFQTTLSVIPDPSHTKRTSKTPENFLIPSPQPINATTYESHHKSLTKNMAYNLMILYPNREGATFDMEYYLESHMPMVERNWQPLGMITWKVIEFGGTAKGGEKAPHSIVCLTSWKDEASCNLVMGGKTAAEVCGDTSRFSNMQPIFIKGRTVALG